MINQQIMLTILFFGMVTVTLAETLIFDTVQASILCFLVVYGLFHVFESLALENKYKASINKRT